MAITTSILTGGSNSHQTTSEEANAFYTDFISEGVVGTLTNTSGVAPATGGFAVNAQGTPDATVAVSAGVAYVNGTPTSQNAQTFRVKNSASENVTISSNSSGSTKYDWVYIKLDATNLNTPNTAGDNVATLVTSRSSSATSDDGTPPTYGYPLAVVTVANGFSTISNSNIRDVRTQTGTSTDTIGASERMFDYVASGCVWTADSAGSTRNASMTSGVVYLSGKRLTVNAVTARSFTASKDVYVDFSDNGDGTAAITYTDNTNNAASPALTAGSLRNAIIVVGASSIAAAASINQGQEDRVLPIASSVAYSVTDSLGNLICPRDSGRRLLGYKQVSSDQGSITSITDLTGLAAPVIVPTGRKIKITSRVRFGNSTVDTINNVYIFESSTQLDADSILTRSGGAGASARPEYTTTPSAGLHTYKLRMDNGGSGTATTKASSNALAWIRVELV